MRDLRRIAIFALISLPLFSCTDEINSTSEWNVIQRVEVKHRSEPVSGIKIVVLEGYRLLCVASPTQGGKTWILLNPKWSPYYKQLPSGKYSITTEELKRINDEGKPTETVIECLRSHLSD